MRKMVFGRKLGRGRKARIALFRSLIRALVARGKIITTKAKAKAIQTDVEKLISGAKEDTVSARREILSYLGNDRKTLELLFTKVAKTFAKRSSGFTRIVSLPQRSGDAAEMARIEWTEKIEIDSKVKSDKSKVDKKAKTGH